MFFIDYKMRGRREMENKFEKNLGITLIALIITIIILLILAGISISALTNQGLFKNAKIAQNATEKAEAEQGQRLNEYEDEINKRVYTFPTSQIKLHNKKYSYF